MRRLRREVDAVVTRLRNELGREPRDEEIAARLNLSLEEYARALNQLRSLDGFALRQLDAPPSDGASVVDLCIDPCDGPEAQLERVELRQRLALALDELPARERQVLSLYYEDELTMVEIGRLIGVCESRVSQLRSLALSRLRATFRFKDERHTVNGPRQPGLDSGPGTRSIVASPAASVARRRQSPSSLRGCAFPGADPYAAS